MDVPERTIDPNLLGHPSISEFKGNIHVISMYVYLDTFTVKISQMLVNIPYMDDMGCEPPVKSDVLRNNLCFVATVYFAMYSTLKPKKIQMSDVWSENFKAMLGGGFIFYVHP